MGGRSADRGGARKLKAFLSAPARPVGTLQYHQLQGFLFAVLSSPQLIRPSEWIPVVFAGHEAGYRSVAEAQSISGELMTTYNEINFAILEGTPAIPADCAFRDDPLENLDPDAPMSQWSQGFSIGHDWLLESWTAHLPEDDDEFGMLVLVLSFFASRPLAEAYRRQLRLREPLTTLAATVRDLFPQALADYASSGRTISQDTANSKSSVHRPRRKSGGKRKR